MKKSRFLILAGLFSIYAILPGCADKTSEGASAETSAIEMQADKDVSIILPEYKNIETGITIREVTNEDVDQVVAETVKNAGGYYKEDNSATVTENCKVFVSVSQKDTEGSSFISSLEISFDDESIPDEFKEALIGLRCNESKDVTLGIGEESVQYILTVQSIQVEADITDEFVQTLDIEGVDTVLELRENITEYLKALNKESFNEEQRKACADYVVKNTTVENIPEELVKDYRDIIDDNISMALEYYAENGEEITRAELITDEINADEFVGTIDEYIDWKAKENAKEFLVLNEIAKVEDIQISEDEIYSRIAQEWADTRDDYPTLIDYMEKYGKDQYARYIVTEKVSEFLANNSKEGLIDTDKDMEGEKKNDSN